MIKKYYRLAKPGIIYGNVFTTIASFLFAARWHWDVSRLELFFATIIGLALVIGSACVFNNVLDRDIDRKMKRTSMRALVTGEISPRSASIYGVILGLLGFSVLTFFVNILTAQLAFFGFIFYVGIYSIVKRTSSWAAVVGSVPGAVPIVVGYTAVTGHFDLTALMLFLILVVWQMPHFYGIALYRLQEYVAAGIPVLPAKKGIHAAKVHILLYIIAFIILTIAFWVRGFAGCLYLVPVVIVGFVWLGKSIQGFRAYDDATWAHKMFRFSLVVLLVFCIMLALSPLLI